MAKKKIVNTEIKFAKVTNSESYDEKKVMENTVKCGKNAIIAHLKHLKAHNEFGYLKQAMDYLVVKGIKMRPSDLI